MKPTDEALAQFYGVVRTTISNWREDKPNLYKAAVFYYVLRGVL
jgi:hypothetical protein